MRTRIRRSLDCLWLLMAGYACASEQQPLTLAECAGIADDARRLACFDRLAAGSLEPKPGRPGQVPVPPQRPFAQREGDILARHWELEPVYKQGLFVFRPHQENYLLIANYLSNPNQVPSSPTRGPSPQSLDLNDVEVKYQLGFKLKMLEDVSRWHADLWFAYTQQSNWQAYNRKASSPFRDTNYQPEFMAVVPLDIGLAGMRARFVNIGYLHESNGQSMALSRSWDRVYAQLGLERGRFTLLARLWERVDNGGSDDDNPDIVRYMGHGDIHATYRWKRHEFAARARGNLQTGKGALRLSWAFPLAMNLKGYVQAFTGYGQSLIDYNHSQTTIGIGVLVTD